MGELSLENPVRAEESHREDKGVKALADEHLQDWSPPAGRFAVPIGPIDRVVIRRCVGWSATARFIVGEDTETSDPGVRTLKSGEFRLRPSDPILTIVAVLSCLIVQDRNG